jgi:hypothetical protein
MLFSCESKAIFALLSQTAGEQHSGKNRSKNKRYSLYTCIIEGYSVKK